MFKIYYLGSEKDNKKSVEAKIIVLCYSLFLEENGKLSQNIYNLLCSWSPYRKWLHFRLRIKISWSSHHGAAETNPTRNHKVVDSIPGLHWWVKDLVLPQAVVLVADTLDPALLWLWCRLVATALIGPLGWEPPYDAGMTLKKPKKNKKQTKKQLCFHY